MQKNRFAQALTVAACCALLTLPTAASHALEVKANNDADALVKALFGSGGLNILSATFKGASEAAGTYTAGLLGLANGIVLSSGKAVETVPPNSSPNFQGTSFNLAGDALCASIEPTYVFNDAARLDATFKLAPGQNGVQMEFVVGSEEYPQYVGTNFNDVVGIFIDGKNVALDAQGNPITINGPFFAGKNVISDCTLDGNKQALCSATSESGKAPSSTARPRDSQLLRR